MNNRGVNLKSWEEFEERIKRLENERINKESEFLYRGQGRKKWEPLTTLERHGKIDLSLRNYFRIISLVKPQIESFTRKNWNIPSLDELDKLLEDNNGTLLFPTIFDIPNDSYQLRDYIIYLRHHNFPSPLLDWSSSQYVAAYFAFNNVLNRDKYVSIFVYLGSKRENGLKFIGGANPWIYPFPSGTKPDQRHKNQKSRYTICVTLNKMHSPEWRYAPHEMVFARNDTKQDVLWKFNIPASERLKVLKQLDKYNINALSLFGSKESLMETMALREIHFK